MDYSEIKLLLSTYSYCKDGATNCNDCPWIKKKGECNFDEHEWNLRLYEVCSELFETVEDLHAKISELQEDNSLLEQHNKALITENNNLFLDNEEYKKRFESYNETMEQHHNTVSAQREVGRKQALEIYHKDVHIAELKAKLEALSSKEEEVWEETW